MVYVSPEQKKEMTKKMELLARSMGDYATQNPWRKKTFVIQKSTLRPSYTDKLGR